MIDTFEFGTIDEQVEKIAARIEITSVRPEQVVAELGLQTGRLVGKCVLDIASGSSNMVNTLRADGVKAVGVDIAYNDFTELDERMDKFSRMQFLEYGDEPNTKDIEAFRKSRGEHPEWYVAGSSTDLPFRNGVFDLAYSYSFLTSYAGIHTEFTERSILEAMRVIKRGGTLVLGSTVPDDERDGMMSMVNKIINENIQAGFESAKSAKLARKIARINLPNRSKVIQITKR